MPCAVAIIVDAPGIKSPITDINRSPKPDRLKIFMIESMGMDPNPFDKSYGAQCKNLCCFFLRRPDRFAG